MITIFQLSGKQRFIKNCVVKYGWIPHHNIEKAVYPDCLFVWMFLYVYGRTAYLSSHRLFFALSS